MLVAGAAPQRRMRTANMISIEGAPQPSATR
jgi:hypothetical protein